MPLEPLGIPVLPAPPPPLAGAVVPSLLMRKQTGDWGTVIRPREKTSHGVGGAREGTKEEGSSLEVSG